MRKLILLLFVIITTLCVATPPITDYPYHDNFADPWIPDNKCTPRW